MNAINTAELRRLAEQATTKNWLSKDRKARRDFANYINPAITIALLDELEAYENTLRYYAEKKESGLAAEVLRVFSKSQEWQKGVDNHDK